MEDFIHVIITRFNVPTESWKVTREGGIPLSEEWLSDRFSIFQKYCLPSFKNQKNQNFIWLVFFDIHTSEKHRKTISEIQQDYPLFTPIYIREFPDMQPKLMEIIPQYFTDKTKFVISSDIDNDDMLHCDFVQTVQQYYQPVNDLVIDLRLGIQLTKTGRRTAFATIFNFASGPFISIVEKIDHFKTVIKENHTKYRNYTKYTYFDKKPLYIQFIHDYNLLNESFADVKRMYHVDFESFGISHKNSFKISKFNTFKHELRRIIKKVIKKISSS